MNNALSGLLSRFAEETASIRVRDPACGSGNILSVSMQRLPNSELDVITFASEMRMPTFFPKVGPEQVHGISYFRRSATNGLLICLLLESVSGRSHRETWAGCIVSLTTPTISSLKASRSVSSLSLAEKASRVLAASYLRR